MASKRSCVAVALGLLLANLTTGGVSAAPRPDPALSQRLTDAIGVKAWPVKVQAFGSIKLVIFNCEECRVGGFAFLDSQSKLITERDILQILEYRIDNDAALKAQHSRVLLTRGGEVFHQVEKRAEGGQRFVFTQLVSECEACMPFTALQFAFDFDAYGKFKGTRDLGYVDVKGGFHGTHPPMEQ